MHKEKKIVTEIGEFHYDEVGTENKQVLLLIHGLAGSKDVWYWNIPVLKHHFHCIALDLPGNGHSSDFKTTHSIHYYTLSVLHFLNAMELETVHWVGHSMGGQIALYAALHFPDRVNKLVLSSPAAFEYFTPLEVQLLKHGIVMNPFLNLDHWLLQEMYKSTFFIQEDKSKILFRKMKEMMQGRGQAQYVKMLKESMIGMLEEQLFHQLHLISHDALVFFGEKDQIIPNALMHASMTAKGLALTACNEMKNGQLITFPDAGHFPHIEKYEEVNALVIEWLNKPLHHV